MLNRLSAALHKSEPVRVVSERNLGLGTDSVAATHYALTNGMADEVVFLHTLTPPEDSHNAINATIKWLESWTDTQSSLREHVEWLTHLGHGGGWCWADCMDTRQLVDYLTQWSSQSQYDPITMRFVEDGGD